MARCAWLAKIVVRPVFLSRKRWAKPSSAMANTYRPDAQPLRVSDHHRPAWPAQLENGDQDCRALSAGQRGEPDLWRPCLSAFCRHDLLRQGVSSSIGALLRHASIETTTLYAKVDPPLLHTVVRAWPEVPSC